METMGERIQKLMKEIGYTQKELATMVGVTESAMSRYLNNERDPKAEIIANIATALHTTSDYLISAKEENQDVAAVFRLVARNAAKMTEQEKLEIITILCGKK